MVVFHYASPIFKALRIPNMKLTSLAFHQLFDRSCALIDLGSAVEFLNSRSIKWMIGEDINWRELALDWNGYTLSQKSSLWNRHLSRINQSPTGCGLRLLEQFIVHDQLILDEAVFNETFKDIAKVWKLEKIARTSLFLPVEIPMNTRMTALKLVAKTSHSLMPINNAITQFYGPDKAAHDGLHNSDMLMPSFANSDDSIQRALYYLEISRIGSLPLVISDAKTNLLKKLKEETTRFIHEYLSQHALSSVSFYSSLDQQGASVVSSELPPLQDLIVRRSLEQVQSPLSVAKEIKDSPPARAYREKLHELWLLRNADFASKQKAAVEVGNLADRITGFAADPSSEIRYRRRKINLEFIPLIGPLLKATGAAEFDIKDPLITPAPKVDIFLSSWFT